MNVVMRSILNTLLGMGTVFIVLILISCVIASFGMISSALKKRAERQAKKAAEAEKIAALKAEEERAAKENSVQAVVAVADAVEEGTAPENTGEESAIEEIVELPAVEEIAEDVRPEEKSAVRPEGTGAPVEDLTLIAVIAAAVAASTGLSPEELYVRNIHRSVTNWKNV